MYYKVVQRDGDILISALARGMAKVEYIPGEWVSAPDFLQEAGYGLLLFDNFEAARDFAGNFEVFEIWEAEAGEKMELPPILQLTKLERGDFVQQIFYDWPDGSVMAERVRLVRPIADEKEVVTA